LCRFSCAASTKLTRGFDLPLAGYAVYSLNRQQFAPTSGPGQAGYRANLVFFFALSWRNLRTPEKSAKIFRGYGYAFVFAFK
jgi:hypothetical protein